MKKNKKLCVLLVGLLVVTIACGCHNPSDSNLPDSSLELGSTSTTITSTTITSTTITSTTITSASAEEIYSPSDILLARTFTLDKAYEKAIAECQCNADFTAVNEAYAKTWYEAGNDYYDLVLQASKTWGEDHIAYRIESKQLEECVKQIHDNLLTQTNESIKLEEEFAHMMYGSGSITPIYLSKFRYVQNRAYALQMYRLCVVMHINCEAP